MTLTWNDKEPIYVQIHAYLAEMILAGLIAPGEALPSVRQVAVEQHVNPITVSKAMQLLVEDGVAVSVGDWGCMWPIMRHLSCGRRCVPDS